MNGFHWIFALQCFWIGVLLLGWLIRPAILLCSSAFFVNFSCAQIVVVVNIQNKANIIKCIVFCSEKYWILTWNRQYSAWKCMVDILLILFVWPKEIDIWNFISTYFTFLVPSLPTKPMKQKPELRKFNLSRSYRITHY